MVPRPEVGPEALEWEHRVQDAGPLENSQPQGRLITKSSHGGLYLNPRPSSTQLPAAPSVGPLTTNKTGTQTHPSAHRLPKVVLSSQTPQNIPLDMALLFRGKRLSSTRQNADTIPSHQEACTRHWTYPTTRGREQKQEELRPCSLGKGDLKYCKLDKMRRQRNSLQAKEQDKNPQDQTNEEETSKLPEKFRVVIVKMIQNLGNRIEKLQEIFHKDLEELKSKQTVMNNTITEIKNTLEGINSRITEAEEQ